MLLGPRGVSWRRPGQAGKATANKPNAYQTPQGGRPMPQGGLTVSGKRRQDEEEVEARRCLAAASAHGSTSSSSSLQETYPAATARAAGLHEEQASSRCNWHLVLHSVFRAPGESSRSQLRKLEALTAARAEHLNTEAWVTVMHALAEAGHRPALPLVAQFMAATGDHLGSLSPRQQRWALQAVRRLGGGAAPLAAWREKCAGALAAAAPHSTVPELVDLCFDAQELGVQQPAEALTCLTRKFSPGALARLSNEQVSRCTWLLGEAGWQPEQPGQTELLLQAVADNVAVFTPAQSISTLYGLARLGCQPPSLLSQSMEAYSAANMQAISPPALSRLLWAFARLGLQPGARSGGSPTSVKTHSAWLAMVISAVQVQAEAAEVQDLAAITLSLSAFGVRLGGAAAQRLQQQQQELKEADRDKLQMLGILPS